LLFAGDFINNKPMSRNYFLLLFLLTPFLLAAQSRKEQAALEIEQLKKGVLLVRLKTGSLQLKSLEDAGNKKEAEAYRNKLKTENEAIVTAFRSQFKFCPVFFFYSNNSEKVRNGDFLNYLLNDELQPDSTMHIPASDYYLTTEFGFTEKQQIQGLVVMDRDFNQLRPPFPYLVRRFQGPARERTILEMVLLLNRDLNAFYSSH
jgi:hypothetical protein